MTACPSSATQINGVDSARLPISPQLPLPRADYTFPEHSELCLPAYPIANAAGRACVQALSYAPPV